MQHGVHSSSLPKIPRFGSHCARAHAAGPLLAHAHGMPARSFLNTAFTRTPEHRNAILIFKRNHVAAASQQKQVLVRLTGILQAFLTYEKKVELLMELMS